MERDQMMNEVGAFIREQNLSDRVQDARFFSPNVLAVQYTNLFEGMIFFDSEHRVLNLTIGSCTSTLVTERLAVLRDLSGPHSMFLTPLGSFIQLFVFAKINLVLISKDVKEDLVLNEESVSFLFK